MDSDEETNNYNEVQRRLSVEKLKSTQDGTENLRGKKKKKKKGGWKSGFGGHSKEVVHDGKGRQNLPLQSKGTPSLVDYDSDGEDMNDYHSVMSKKKRNHFGLFC